MKILAIDQSQTGKCGYALFDGQSLLFSGIEEYKGIKSARQRFKRFVRVIGMLVQEHTPDVVVMEQVRLFHHAGINIHTIVILAGMIALVEVLTPSETPVWLVNTSSWKKGVLGNGRADKQASVAYVKAIFQKDVCDDEADAICLGVYMEAHLRLGGGMSIKNIIELAI